MNEHVTLLLDTNVWLDNYLASRQGHLSSRKAIELALQSNIALAYAVTSLKDVYYLVASEFKRLSRKEMGELTATAAKAAEVAAWGCVNNMQEIACAIPLDHTDVWVASKQRVLHTDFEDDLIIAAALRAKADYLVTNDERLLRHCPVAALDVADMTRVLEARAAELGKL